MGIIFTDLDERPDLLEPTCALFRAHGPGRHHAVHGEPKRIGLPVQQRDLLDCLGVLIALENGILVGALGLCSYSDEQITLWGPITTRPEDTPVADALLHTAREVLQDSTYESLRTQIDIRNRYLRSFFLNHGYRAWKNNAIYTRPFTAQLTQPLIESVTRSTRSEHDLLFRIFSECFPESGHHDVTLEEREQEGYRHYHLIHKNNIIGAAAVHGGSKRSWLSLFGVQSTQRGHGYGNELLAGLLAREERTNAQSIALEVLDDNTSAKKVYEHHGFQRLLTTAIITGPV